MDELYIPMFYGEEAAQIFAPASYAAKLMAFEVALAYALEESAIAPAGTGRACEAAVAPANDSREWPWLDLATLSKEAVPAGNLAIPFVKRMTAQVYSQSRAAAGFVHLGATSQDLLDTALVLQLREIASLADRKLGRVVQLLTGLAETHRNTVMAGRTWLQQGPPVTFGLKAAGWLAATLRARTRLRSAAQQACTLQFGGAVGTLASLQERGPEVAAALGRRLELPVPDMPWHTHRDSLVELAAEFALLNGTLGKMARDISLLMQNEVGEAFEPATPGKGGSSTMPHKRNPVACAYILASAARTPGLLATLLSVMPQEHERGLGGWHAEWQTLPELCLLTAGSLEHSIGLLDGLEVATGRMEANLRTAGDYAMGESMVARLTPRLGRLAAHHRVEALTRKALEQGSSLADALLADPEIRQLLTEDDVRQSLTPSGYLGSSSTFIDRVLAEARKQV